MPDWYVQRNSDGPYPYQVRLGGCEYSLTQAEFEDLFAAFAAVANVVDGPYCVQSEDYQDLVIASSDNKRSLDDIMKLPKPNTDPIRRF